MVARMQQRGNRETRKPKQVKSAAPQTVNPFAAVNKGSPSGNAGGKGNKG